MEDKSATIESNQTVSNVGTPPMLIGGVNSHTCDSDLKTGMPNQVGIHGFRISFDESLRNPIHEVLKAFFGKITEKKPWGRYMYDRHNIYDTAVMYFHSGAGARTRGALCVEVPGESCEDLGLFGSHQLILALAKVGVKATRIDTFFDDYSRRITPAQIVKDVHEMINGIEVKRNYIGAKTIDPRQPCGTGKAKGDSVYFGVRGCNGSGKLTRIYDKNLESGGLQDCIRYENEWTGDRAEIVWTGLVSCVDNTDDADRYMGRISKLIGQIIGSSMDFRKRWEKPRETNLARIPRFEWWQTIIDELGEGVKVQPRKKETTVQSSMDSVEVQVIPRIQALRIALTPDEFYTWFLDLIEGTDRLQARHKKMIQKHFIATREMGCDVSALREVCDKAGIQLESD